VNIAALDRRKRRVHRTTPPSQDEDGVRVREDGTHLPTVFWARDLDPSGHVVDPLTDGSSPPPWGLIATPRHPALTSRENAKKNLISPLLGTRVPHVVSPGNGAGWRGWVVRDRFVAVV
jgi:hypothetical protein